MVADMNKTLLAKCCREFVESFESVPTPPDLRHSLLVSYVRGIGSLASVIDNPQLVQLCDDICQLGVQDLNKFVMTGNLPPVK